jgi:hypothetical protein
VDKLTKEVKPKVNQNRNRDLSQSANKLVPEGLLKLKIFRFSLEDTRNKLNGGKEKSTTVPEATKPIRKRELNWNKKK